MVIVIGGANHGKLTFIKNYVKSEHLDLAQNKSSDLNNYQILYNFHHLIDKYPDFNEYCNNNLERLQNKIIIVDEVGLGIVPLDRNLRIKRDELGRSYQTLNAKATVVIRVWYGIAIYLKGNEEQFKNIIKEGEQNG